MPPFVPELQLAKKKKKKKKTKTGSFEARLFLSRIFRLPLRSVYSKTVQYLAVRSLLSPVICVFSNFAPIPMYREYETPCVNPTALSDTVYIYTYMLLY